MLTAGTSSKVSKTGFTLDPPFLITSPEMSVETARYHPVLCVKRVSSLTRASSHQRQPSPTELSFTRRTLLRQEFANRIHGGMVGANVGIPVPISIFRSKTDLLRNCIRSEGRRFYTETKVVTTHWFKEKEKARERVDTWDGTI